MFNLSLSRNFSVAKLFFKSFSFLKYEKYYSLFMVNFHGLVTYPLEHHSRMCTQRAVSYQQHCSQAEFTYCQLSTDY